MIFRFVQNTIQLSENIAVLEVPWLQINKTSQVGGVLESSGHPLDVGHYKSHIDYLRLTLG